jgi:hypothetical protein
MTLSLTTVVSSPSPLTEVSMTAREDSPGARCEWRYCLAGVAILGVAYLLLQNGKWVSGPDTAFYISVARNLALGRGFIFNGAVVGRIPPLWPAVLALGMKISTSLWLLNLLPMIGLLGGAAVWYWVLRRLTSPRGALWGVVLSGILFFTYTSSIQLRTEGLFSLVFAPALLLAMQIGEGKSLAWRLPALLILCIGMVMTRWAGLAAWAVVGAAIMSGKRPVSVGRWVALLASFVVVVGTFGLTRFILSTLPPPPRTWVMESGKKGPKIPDEDTEGTVKMQSLLTPRGLKSTLLSMANSGKWMSSLMWMPMYMGVTHGMVGIATNIIGWGLILLCAVVAWRDGKLGQWIWVGAFLYCAAMVFRVRVANPRYLVPVAPLLVLGVIRGLEYLKASVTPWKSLWGFSLGMFVVSIVAVNGALWGIDVWINHSTNFYSRYRAGEMEKLIASADYMRERGVGDGEIAVNVFYVNLGRQRPNGEGLRTMILLTDRGVRGGPAGCAGEPNDVLLKWAARFDVKYYLYRPPVSPWRALHFKLKRVQQVLTGKEDIPENPSWVLYELKRGGAVKVELPQKMVEMGRVPGMAK